MQVLWIAPNINHYKARLLDSLARDERIDLTVFSGQVDLRLGHRANIANHAFTHRQLSVTKRYFAWHPGVFTRLTKTVFEQAPDIILFPLEKKLLPLLLWVKCLCVMRNIRLYSYNHPLIRFRNSEGGRLTALGSKLLFRIFDRVIFYTDEARETAVSSGLIAPQKADFANNTLDTEEIQTQRLGPPVLKSRPLRLLFIGRLIPAKRIDLALSYYQALKQLRPDLCLTIIGDGPLADMVATASEDDPDINWVGALTKEADISPHMAAAHAVFMPGDSGLSVVHALAYGKPYITLDLRTLRHGPEISYLKDGENGLLLPGDVDSDRERLLDSLEDETVYAAMCAAAEVKGQSLSVNNWTSQIISAFQR